MKKRNLLIIGMMMAAMTLGAIGCGGTDGTETTDSSQETTASDETEPETEEADAEETDGEEAEPVNLLIAAAASLEYSMEDELIPMFEEQNPGITVEGTYDSSGKLQTQIEEGLDADVFFSAATKQMDALAEEGLVEESSVKDLLENKIVLIVLTVKMDNTIVPSSKDDIEKTIESLVVLLKKGTDNPPGSLNFLLS